MRILLCIVGVVCLLGSGLLHLEIKELYRESHRLERMADDAKASTELVRACRSYIIDHMEGGAVQAVQREGFFGGIMEPSVGQCTAVDRLYTANDNYMETFGSVAVLMSCKTHNTGTENDRGGWAGSPTIHVACYTPEGGKVIHADVYFDPYWRHASLAGFTFQNPKTGIPGFTFNMLPKGSTFGSNGRPRHDPYGRNPLNYEVLFRNKVKAVYGRDTRFGIDRYLEIKEKSDDVYFHAQDDLEPIRNWVGIAGGGALFLAGILPPRRRRKA